MDEQDLMDLYEERAAIMEYDGGLMRSQAERLARKEVYGANPVDTSHALPPAAT